MLNQLYKNIEDSGSEKVHSLVSLYRMSHKPSSLHNRSPESAILLASTPLPQ